MRRDPKRPAILGRLRNPLFDGQRKRRDPSALARPRSGYRTTLVAGADRTRKSSTPKVEGNFEPALIFRRWKAGAANRTRTCDPVITNDVLYQLSYCGGPNAASGTGPETPAPDIGDGPDWQEKRGRQKPSYHPSVTKIPASRRPGPWTGRFVPRIRRARPRHRRLDHRAPG